jgi:hypothetical protein
MQAESFHEVLAPLRNRLLRVVEIGSTSANASNLQSLRIWLGVFQHAQVFRMDCNDCSEFANPRVRYFRGDAARMDDIESFKAWLGRGVDVIIDVSLHGSTLNAPRFTALFQHLKPQGLYVRTHNGKLEYTRNTAMTDQAADTQHFATPFIASVALSTRVRSEVDETLERLQNSLVRVFGGRPMPTIEPALPAQPTVLLGVESTGTKARLYLRPASNSAERMPLESAAPAHREAALSAVEALCKAAATVVRTQESDLQHALQTANRSIAALESYEPM